MNKWIYIYMTDPGHPWQPRSKNRACLAAQSRRSGIGKLTKMRMQTICLSVGLFAYMFIFKKHWIVPFQRQSFTDKILLKGEMDEDRSLVSLVSAKVVFYSQLLEYLNRGKSNDIWQCLDNLHRHCFLDCLYALIEWTLKAVSKEQALQTSWIHHFANM